MSKQYPYIRAWGRMMQSYAYYIEGEVERAMADNAPANAIYQRDGKWYTLDDIKSDDTRQEVLRLAGEV